jgi:transcriptional regulator with XRE-family HTH domain
MAKIIKHPEFVRWNLKRALIERRMLAQDLAKKVGTSRAYLSHVIVGRYPGWPYRKKIAAILGYDEDWLFKQGEGNVDSDHY